MEDIRALLDVSNNSEKFRRIRDAFEAEFGLLDAPDQTAVWVSFMTHYTSLVACRQVKYDLVQGPLIGQQPGIWQVYTMAQAVNTSFVQTLQLVLDITTEEMNQDDGED